MKNISISPQMQAAYQLLLANKRMTVAQMARSMNVLPNAVYRLLKKLEHAGFITREGGFPVRYQAIPTGESIERFLNHERQWFESTFGQNMKANDSLQLSFIQNREESLTRFSYDLASAHSEANLLVSGLEIPAEVMLEYKNACDRGVKLRILVQKSGTLNRTLIESWEKIGASVRTCASIESRLFTIDSQIAYLLSYQENNPGQALGVRFAYPPIVALLKENFFMRWKNAL